MQLVVSGTSRLVRWNKTAVMRTVKPFMHENSKSGLCISFASSRFMRWMNREYRGKDKNTDILSFPDEQMIGTIYINPQVVMRKARHHRGHVVRLFRRLLIHGLAHLLGHDHETINEWKVMRRVEQSLWRQLPNTPLVKYQGTV